MKRKKKLNLIIQKESSAINDCKKKKEKGKNEEK